MLYIRIWYPLSSCHRNIAVLAIDGNWHHICASWKNTGAWQFYKDGLMHTHSTGFQTGYTIKAGGSLMLGQEQDSVGGGLDASQSLKGMLTNVNLWNRVLTPAQIKAMSKSCRAGVGNVYRWTDFIHGVKGNTAIVIPSSCSPWLRCWNDCPATGRLCGWPFKLVKIKELPKRKHNLTTAI